MALDMVNRISEDTQLFFYALVDHCPTPHSGAFVLLFSDGRVPCRTPSLFTGRVGPVHGALVVYHLGYSSRNEDDDDDGKVTT